MTTIAYDSVMLAGDRLCESNGIPTQRTKVYSGCDDTLLVGCAGEAQDSILFRRWLESGVIEDKKPKVENSFNALVVERESGKAFLYEHKLAPILIEDKYYAIGSGRDFAWMAMNMGFSAREAVKKASEFDIYTGNGVDVIPVARPV